MRLALILLTFYGWLRAHNTPAECFIESSIFGNVSDSILYSNMGDLKTSYVNGMSLESLFFCNGTQNSDIALTHLELVLQDAEHPKE